MELVRVMPAGLQFADDLAHSLQMIAVRNQYRVRRVDNDQILDAHRGDHAIFGMDEGVASRNRYPRSLSAVAVGVGRGQRRYGLPRTDIAPIEGAANDGD